MAWLFPPLQQMVEYRTTDTIIAVPAKSGTTWSMNIFYQLREGGNPNFADIYKEIPWVEFKERPDQPNEELLERWKNMPMDVPRGFKSHAAPGGMLEYHPELKYLVVVRNPEEAIVSFKPFLEGHSDDLWKLWNAEGMKPSMVRPELSFEQWYFDVAVNWQPPGPPGSPEVPFGMMTVFFWSFINGWWPLRNQPNVCMIHFSDMKRDHEGTVRKIANFLGFQPTAEQWPRILEYTSFDWMKRNEEKFEAATIAPVPIMHKGSMVRKGATGKQAEDGMTPLVAENIRQQMEQMVPDPQARQWMMYGGALPPDPVTYTGFLVYYSLSDTSGPMKNVTEPMRATATPMPEELMPQFFPNGLSMNIQPMIVGDGSTPVPQQAVPLPVNGSQVLNVPAVPAKEKKAKKDKSSNSEKKDKKDKSSKKLKTSKKKKGCC